jgi:aspartate racemase
LIPTPGFPTELLLSLAGGSHRFRPWSQGAGLWKGPAPILSIFDAIAEAIRRKLPEIKTVGLMGTKATIKAGFVQKRLAQDNITTVFPDRAAQAKILDAIKDIKNVLSSRSRSEITTDLIEAARSLIDAKPEGAEAIIAGCTEIPLALSQEHLPVPYFDSLAILARAAIRYAGQTPVN